MNYLAHVLLSGRDPDWQLGGYLGDFVKGSLQQIVVCKQAEPWSENVVAGMQLHRYLDAEVDFQPYYRHSLQLLTPQVRRFGGIALDVFYDHLLSRHWTKFDDTPLLQFSRDFYANCLARRQRLPDRAEKFISAAAKAELFVGYGDKEIYRKVILRIGQRLSFAGADVKLLAAADQLLENYELVEADFLYQFPELIQLAQRWRQQRQSL